MPRIIEFRGQRHSFPDNATDEQIAGALEALTPTPDNNPDAIGHRTGDKRKMTDAQLLQVLEAQRSDPYRDSAADAELEREIAQARARVQKGVKEPAAAPAASAADAPRPSQSDVRSSEPYDPLGDQDEKERSYKAALAAWLKTPQGRPFANYPYNDPEKQRAEFSKRTGRPDPRASRQQAELDYAAATGNVVHGNSPGYEISKTLAGIGGFAVGGPAGATGAEFGVRYLSLVENLQRAVEAGAIDEARAAQIMRDSLLKGTGTDAAFNFGLPLVGQGIGWLAKKVPAAKWLRKVADAVIPEKATIEAARQAKVDKLAGKAATPERAQAVRELVKRTGDDFVPTPAQVKGESGMVEGTVNKAFPAQFEKQEKALDAATEGMRRELLYPSEQPTRQTLGERIVKAADDVTKAVKQRLRPTFNAADNLGVRVDFTEVEKMAREALEKAERVPSNTPQASKEVEALRKLVDWFDKRAVRDGAQPLHEMKDELARLLASRDLARQEWGKFKTFEARQNVLADNFYPVPGQPRVPGKYSEHPLRAAEGASAAADAERIARQRLADAEKLTPRIAELQSTIGALEGHPLLKAEDALDFMSLQKAGLRTSPEWAPSTGFESFTNKLVEKADEAYAAAAAKSGNPNVVRDLNKARTEYREMMETVYDDSMKQVLRKDAGGSPEDIGQYLWQNGKVSRIEQLHEMLGLSVKEGAMGKAAAEKMQRDVTRGFLQDAVKSVDDAANFSKRLAADARRAETWDMLTRTPAGKQLKDGMKVLEEAAQMAKMRDSSKNYIPLLGVATGRAAQGGLGVSYVTGAIHPGMAVAGLSIAAMMKAMSTAYTHGDKGAINLMTRVLKSYSAGTGASAKALQELLPGLEDVAQQYGAEDIFVPLADEQNYPGAGVANPMKLLSP